MSLLETIGGALGRWPQPFADGPRVIVPTHCLFSSGAIVNVVIEGGRETFRVHDDANAIRAFEAAGGEITGAVRIVQSMAKSRGLAGARDGAVSSPLAGLHEVAGAVALVANAARDIESHLLDRWKPVLRRKFKDVVAELIRNEFPQRWHQDAHLVGKSNKHHRFDFSIDLPDRRKLLIDAVVPEASAINTAVVRHLDVGESHGDELVRRILYDDRLPWKASDLNLLRLGARTVAFSDARGVLDRIAA